MKNARMIIWLMVFIGVLLVLCDDALQDGLIAYYPFNGNANATLVAACFNVGEITYERNDVIDDGNVVSTEPAYGNYPDCNSDVNYVVSTGDSGDCPLDITGWEGIPDGFVGPEDVLYMTILTNGCPYGYCAVEELTAAEQCLDVTSWVPGVPDSFVGPEDVLYIITLINGCPYQYCSCPIQ